MHRPLLVPVKAAVFSRSPKRLHYPLIKEYPLNIIWFKVYSLIKDYSLSYSKIRSMIYGMFVD